MKKLPAALAPILWSTPLNRLSLSKHKAYIIHQVLMYGNFQDIRWLFRTYPKEEIKKVFISNPQKIYTKEAFNYIKDFILEIKDKRLSPQKYVNTLY